MEYSAIYKEVSSTVHRTADQFLLLTSGPTHSPIPPLIADGQGQLEKIKLGFNCLLKMLIVIVKYLIASVEILLICLQSSDLTCQE